MLVKMTRAKVKLAYITNNSKRKTCYKKRVKGLINKVREISVLCGVDACGIIYSPFDAEPVFWPSRPGTEAVLARFANTPVMDRTWKKLNQESFTLQRCKKLEGKLRRIQAENKRSEMERFMYQCIAGTASLDDLDVNNSKEMGPVINQALRDIESKMEALRIKGQGGPAVAAPPPVAVTPSVEPAVVEPLVTGPTHVEPAVGPVAGEGNYLEGFDMDDFGWDFGEMPCPDMFDTYYWPYGGTSNANN